jgi:hypothetical protein
LSIYVNVLLSLAMQEHGKFYTTLFDHPIYELEPVSGTISSPWSLVCVKYASRRIQTYT